MKRFILISLVLFSVTYSEAQITFFKGSWEEVLKEASETKKPIFVDFYATWCGPCKYMSKKVFTNPDVAKLYNQNFISFKVDAESEEKALVEKVQLKAYPTLVYFDHTGELILSNVGAMEAHDMIQKGNQIINFKKNKASFEGNPKNINALKDYLSILKHTNYASARGIGLNYLSTLTEEELTKEENWFFIHSFAHDHNSREFIFIVNNPKTFIRHGHEFEEYYKMGAKGLMLEAIKTKDYSKVDLHKKYHVAVHQAMNLLKYPEEYYGTLIDMMYYDGIGDEEAFFNSTIDWLEKYNMNKAEILCEYSLKLSEKLRDTNKIKEVKKFAEKAVALQNDHNTNYTLSFVLYKAGEKEEAIKYANYAKAKCTDEQVLPYLDAYINEIKK